MAKLQNLREKHLLAGCHDVSCTLKTQVRIFQTIVEVSNPWDYSQIIQVIEKPLFSVETGMVTWGSPMT